MIQTINVPRSLFELKKIVACLFQMHNSDVNLNEQPCHSQLRLLCNGLEIRWHWQRGSGLLRFSLEFFV